LLAASTWTAPSEDRRFKLVGLILLASAAAAFLSNHAAAQWPLSADRFLGFALVALFAVSLLAAGLLVLAAGCGAARTFHNPGRRRAVGLQILLANVLAPALLYGLFVDDPRVAAAIASRDWDVAAPVVGYALLFAAWRLWRCSRRYDAVSAEEAMALDQRPPVLYLRFFHDDDALIDDGGSTLAPGSCRPSARLRRSRRCPTSSLASAPSSRSASPANRCRSSARRASTSRTTSGSARLSS
jgi:hypothetical protein